MPRPKRLLIPLLAFAATLPAAEFSGARALEQTRRAIAFGPRPSGSAAIRSLQAHIRAELKPLRCELMEDRFAANTPNGPVEMVNLIARFKGASGRAIAITGHYDTKIFSEFRFVGANDGGSSAGLLLELARAVSDRPRKDDLYLVWFDGEEAVRDWTDTDSLYGSRHLAARWAREGVLTRLKALINVDMTGDKDLDIVDESNSSPSLRRLIWGTAGKLGYGKYFLDRGGAIEDDHMPFVRLGVNAADLIDFNYGLMNRWWHTAGDTMDKLSAHSFDVVGNVLLAVISELEGSR